MSERGGARVRRIRLPIQPCALAETAWNLPVSAACALAMTVVFLAEILTPDVVVGALQLVPLTCAMWLLSGRSAATIAVIAGALVGASLVLEPTNTGTILILAVSMLLIAVLTRTQAVALARSTGSGPEFAGLTERELQVAHLACQAYTACEIGAQLHISERTVETHLAKTYTKLRISSRRDLIRMASRLEQV